MTHLTMPKLKPASSKKPTFASSTTALGGRQRKYLRPDGRLTIDALELLVTKGTEMFRPFVFLYEPEWFGKRMQIEPIYYMRYLHWERKRVLALLEHAIRPELPKFGHYLAYAERKRIDYHRLLKIGDTIPNHFWCWSKPMDYIGDHLRMYADGIDTRHIPPPRLEPMNGRLGINKTYDTYRKYTCNFEGLSESLLYVKNQITGGVS